MAGNASVSCHGNWTSVHSLLAVQFIVLSNSLSGTHWLGILVFAHCTCVTTVCAGVHMCVCVGGGGGGWMCVCVCGGGGGGLWELNVCDCVCVCGGGGGGGLWELNVCECV